jgi:hypothetical protein
MTSRLVSILASFEVLVMLLIMVLSRTRSSCIFEVRVSLIRPAFFTRIRVDVRRGVR